MSNLTQREAMDKVIHAAMIRYETDNDATLQSILDEAVDAILALSPPSDAGVADLRALVVELADDLEAELRGRYGHMLDHPAMKMRFDRDMATVNAAREKLAQEAALRTPAPSRSDGEVECHGLDTPNRVCFYEQDFYVLSNFSSFSIQWKGLRFDTSEHLYHWLKFASSPDGISAKPSIAFDILNAPSAHAAFKIAEINRAVRRPDWDDVKVDLMRKILRTKTDQHEYVHRKLLSTGDRELVENSWRDDFWGWGPNHDGKNMLGKLWMEIRAELRTALSTDRKERS